MSLINASRVRLKAPHSGPFRAPHAPKGKPDKDDADQKPSPWGKVAPQATDEGYNNEKSAEDFSSPFD